MRERASRPKSMERMENYKEILKKAEMQAERVGFSLKELRSAIRGSYRKYNRSKK
jgi:hypothetical protein